MKDLNLLKVHPENFFLYFEETDYCRRSNKNNYKIYQVNSQKVYHDIGTSVETKNDKEIGQAGQISGRDERNGPSRSLESTYFFSTARKL